MYSILRAPGLNIERFPVIKGTRGSTQVSFRFRLGLMTLDKKLNFVYKKASINELNLQLLCQFSIVGSLKPATFTKM